MRRPLRLHYSGRVSAPGPGAGAMCPPSPLPLQQVNDDRSYKLQVKLIGSVPCVAAGETCPSPVVPTVHAAGPTATTTWVCTTGGPSSWTMQCVHWSLASVLLQRDALHLPSREGPGGEAAAVPVRGPRHPLRTLHLRPGQPHEVGRLQILVQISQKLCKGNLNFSHSVMSRVK